MISQLLDVWFVVFAVVRLNLLAQILEFATDLNYQLFFSFC
jgi:hypothetical protein